MELKLQIAEAEAAYYKLISGKTAEEIVDQNGERVRFSSGDAERLKRHISELKSKQSCGGNAMRVFL